VSYFAKKLSEAEVLETLENLNSMGYLLIESCKDIAEAIEFGSIDDLKHFISSSSPSDLNSMLSIDLSENMTPLMLAASSGNYAEELINIAAPTVDESEKSQQYHKIDLNPIMLASIIGNYPAAELLILNGANINIVDENNISPLMLAIENLHDDIAMMLIDRGADVNAKNKNNYSALMIAVSKDLPHIVDLMIKKGVEVNSKNKLQQTALTIALRFDNIAAVNSLIIAGASTDDIDESHNSADYYAESEEAKEILKEKNSIDIDTTPSNKSQNFQRFLNKRTIIPITSIFLIIITLIIIKTFLS